MTGCPPQVQQAYRVFADAPTVPYSSYHYSSASAHLNSSYLFRDPKKYSTLEIEMITPKTARNRRKGTSGDQVKHRRTRSGCFTCRSRRVKCDEGRPVCERCRKGSRDCSYPDPTSSKSPTDAKGGKSNNEDQHDSSDEGSDDGNDDDRMETIMDEDEPQSEGSGRAGLAPSIRAGNNRNYTSSDTPSLITDHGLSPTPSTEGSAYNTTTATISRYKTKTKSGVSERELPHDIQFFLKYFIENITYHHFSLKMDVDHILRTAFFDEALGNEALLNALVGFSAYHYTLQRPDGKIQDFLMYYNKAVTLLLTSLKRGDKPNISHLLTMLQLAAIEEFLGDWVNLLGHQKAACALLTTLFTPQTITDKPIGHMILTWYIRFDLYGALIGGYRSALPEPWLYLPHQYNIAKAEAAKGDPNELSHKIDKIITGLRVISYELANLSADVTKQRISMEQFYAEEKTISSKLEEWEKAMDPAILDQSYAVTDFTGARPPDPDDIVDPFQPGLLFRGPLWPMNILRQDHMGVEIMLKYLKFSFAKNMGKESGKDGSPEHKDLQQLAYKTCQLFEAIEYWPGSPKGSIIGAQAGLGVAPLLLPKDKRHERWFRRKMAVVEINGYIYASTFRKNMSEIWGDPTVMDWWFPNYQDCPPVIKIIHDFVEERSAPAKDEMTEDLKNMSQIFKGMTMESGDSSSSKSSSMEPQFEQDSPGGRQF